MCFHTVSNTGGEQSDWSWSEQTAGLEGRPEESTAGGKLFNCVKIILY